LPEAYIAAATKPGGFVIDPFGGAGTTLIAAERLDRRALLMEIEPAYCDVTIERFRRWTEGGRR
jgi:DNA modification methylase